MSMFHEFGLIYKFSYKNMKKYTEYTPEKYNCISVHDDYIQALCCKFGNIETVNPCIPEKYNGLCYYGITIIPAEACRKILTILNNENNIAFDELERLLETAVSSGKYVIHYGL